MNLPKLIKKDLTDIERKYKIKIEKKKHVELIEVTNLQKIGFTEK